MWVLELVMCPELVAITQNLILFKFKMWNQVGTKTKVKEVKGIGCEPFPLHFFFGFTNNYSQAWVLNGLKNQNQY